MRYPAILDGSRGAYGVTFPDLPGVVAMGETIDEAIMNAEAALHDAYVEARTDGQALVAPTAPEDVHVDPGHTLLSIPLIRPAGRTARANMTIDAGVLEFIDTEASRRGMTRTAFTEWMARRVAGQGG